MTVEIGGRCWIEDKIIEGKDFKTVSGQGHWGIIYVCKEISKDNDGSNTGGDTEPKQKNFKEWGRVTQICRQQQYGENYIAKEIVIYAKLCGLA